MYDDYLNPPNQQYALDVPNINNTALPITNANASISRTSPDVVNQEPSIWNPEPFYNYQNRPI